MVTVQKEELLSSVRGPIVTKEFNDIESGQPTTRRKLQRMRVADEPSLATTQAHGC